MRDARFSSKAYGTHDFKEITTEGRVQFDLLQVGNIHGGKRRAGPRKAGRAGSCWLQGQRLPHARAMLVQPRICSCCVP